jgi:hypothetical protein
VSFTVEFMLLTATCMFALLLRLQTKPAAGGFSFGGAATPSPFGAPSQVKPMWKAI